MSQAVLITYATALFIAAVIPGPGMTAIVARALGSGFWQTFFMGLGLILGDLTYLTAVILGLAIVAQTFQGVFFLLKIAGALYLLYIAWKLWTAGLMPQNLKAKRSTNAALAFLSGLLITLGNPKTMLFYVALVPTIVDLRAIGTAEFTQLVTVTFFVLMAALLPYILLATKARDLLSTPERLKILNRTAAGILAGTAAMIVLRPN
jgi:threonine/homoserine/homoserine lactone efflux protein